MHRRYPAHSGNIRPGIKKAANALFGGVKVVGRVTKKVITWPAKQIEKEWRGEDEEIENFRKKQKERGNI